MLKNQKGLTRDTIDKFYTNKEIVKLCCQKTKQQLMIKNTDLIIEPSAGNGSFISEIKKMSNNYLFLDIEPDHPEIMKQDFLSLKTNKLEEKYNKIHLIGNPPFGRQSSMAIKFIKKAGLFCDSISFILPKSFKKDSMKSKFPFYFHCVYQVDLPENSFIVNGEEHNVPCLFQIWVKKDTMRPIVPKLEPINYYFVNKEDSPDISFRRVGVYAGKIDTEIESKSVQSHYFIKFKNNILTNTLYKKLSTIEYNHNNTVGPKSISKQELIQTFNQIIIS